MTRPKGPRTAAEIEAEIRRLEEAKAHAIAAEDQRRGELLRGYLAGPHGDAIRAALRHVAGPRDAHLFGLDTLDGPDVRDAGARHTRPRPASRSASVPASTPAARVDLTRA